MNIKKLVGLLLIPALFAAMSVSASANGEEGGAVDPNIVISAYTPAPEVVGETTDPTPVDPVQTTEDPNGQSGEAILPAPDTETTGESTVPAVFAITKHPYSESISEGSVTSFVAKASAASSARWIIKDANGNNASNDHISIKEPYYDNGELVAKVVINNAPVSISGWSFSAIFNESLTTGPATLTVYYAASTATPRPVQTPIPTATPSPTREPPPAPEAEATPIPTFTPGPTPTPIADTKEYADGGAGASLGKILTVIVIAGAAAVVAVVGILAGSGILGGSKKKKRRRRR